MVKTDIEKLTIMRDILVEISRVSLQIVEEKAENNDTIKARETLFSNLQENQVNLNSINQSSKTIKTLVKEIKTLFLSISSDSHAINDTLKESLNEIKGKLNKFVPVKKVIGKYEIHSRKQ